MKIIKRISVLAIAMAFSTLAIAQDKKANNIDDSKIGLQGYSPVSYLDLGLAQRGLKQHKSVYNEIAFYFTSAEQKSVFDKQPAKYMPQFGGFCAFGVYAGAKFRVDPTKFIVSNGKYYLFLNDLEVDAKQLWISEDETTLVKKANQNWKQLMTK